MILRLPTRGNGTYRGLYPNRVASFGGTKGCYHVELNDRSRYVFTPDELLSNCSGRINFMGAEFDELFGEQPHDVAEMSLNDYAGVLFVIKVVRAVRFGWGMAAELTVRD